MDRVFAYGSLVSAPGAVPARLDGFRRTWGVAMDNSVDLPGYKCYLDATGRRPAVCVAFLDLVEDPAARTAGALIAVTPDRLRALDVRERNYERRDVSEHFGGGRVWTYVGREDSRERFRRALAAGRAVVQRGYLECCDAPEPPPCPVLDLRRVELQ